MIAGARVCTLTVFLSAVCASAPLPVVAFDGEYPELEQLYREVIDLRHQVLEERGRIRVLDLESTVLSEHLNTVAPVTTNPAPRVLPVVREQWVRSAESRTKALDAYLGPRLAVLKQARQDWEQAQFSSLRFREHVRSLESQLGVDQDSTRAFTWLVLLLWLSPSFVLLLLVSLMLRLHERRIDMRKTLRSQSFVRTAAPLLAAVLPTLLSGCGQQEALTPTATWLKAETEALAALKSELTAELKTVRLQRAAREQAVLKQRTAVRKRLETLFHGASGAEFTAVSRTVLDMEDKGLAQLESGLQVDALLDLYQRDAASTVDELAQRRAELSAFVGRHQTRTTWIAAAGLTGAGTALVVGACPFVLAWTRSMRRYRANRRVCPRCLGAGTLKRERSKSMVECTACKGRFPASLLNIDRLCFPTVGVRGSGKTHWIVEFFDEIRNTDLQTDASLKWVESGSEVEQKFDGILDALRRGEGPDGTVYEQDRIPEPVLFSVRDCDWMRPANDLSLLVFDLSGEVMTKELDLDKLKERAMTMDGFLLFLDPRQVRADSQMRNGKKLWLSKDDQLKGVHKQRRDMKAARHLGDNDVLDVPVAVCIPKLDLLEKHNPLGGASRELLEELRETEHQPVTLDLIDKRSDIVTRYLREMFDGWNIQREMEENFGARYRFFPLTPVNINADEIGIEDLKDRKRNPFGIQEPVLWLLHMSGYSVLK